MNTLLSLWLHLTGGEQGCPRGRFALTLLAAYGLYHLLLPGFVRCALAIEQQELPETGGYLLGLLVIAAVVVVFVSLLLIFLPLSPLALLGIEASLIHAWQQIQGGAPPAAAPETLWPYWLGFLLGAPALFLVSSVAFGASWRRLKDAGRSPLFLLLGLTYVLGFGYDGSYAAESAGLYLLGPLWLIILYSQRSRMQKGFAIFRSVR